jgi:spore coat polysaccharide biosynthesis protein SpsF
MSTVAIIQARMGSTRLPGKVLRKIEGKSMLARVAGRLRQASLLDAIVVATTDQSRDDAIVEECRRIPVAVFRGSELDVLDRYFMAAQAHRSDTVVRVSADCPLIDPEVVDQVVGVFGHEKPDYASNTLERTYPRGLDTEVMTFGCLQRAWTEAHEPYQRVHVTPYIYQNPDKFRLRSIISEKDYSHYRWTVDTPEDLQFVRTLYALLENEDRFSWREVLRVLSQNSGLDSLNQHIRQKDLEAG